MSTTDEDGYERPPKTDVETPLLDVLGGPTEKDGRIPDAVWRAHERVAWLWWRSGLERCVWINVPDDADEVRRVPFEEVDGDCAVYGFETSERLVAFEVKTQSNLRQGQIDRQTRYLQTQVDEGKFESWDYVLLTQSGQKSNGAYPHLGWDDVHQELATIVGRVDSDTDVFRLRDWMRAIDKHLVDQRDFGPESKLVLRYEETLDELGIAYDEDAYIEDRRQLFKRLRKWLQDEYELSAGEGGEWTSRTLPSRVQRNSDIYRIGKKRWKKEGIRFEVLARDKRLKHGTDHGGDSSYRSHDSLIEVTLWHRISKTDARSSSESPSEGDKQRQRLHAKLVEDGYWESLQAAGFRRTRTLQTEDEPLSRYHMYSREVRLFDHDGKGVFSAVQDAVAALMDAQSSIDEFVEAELTRKR